MTAKKFLLKMLFGGAKIAFIKNKGRNKKIIESWENRDQVKKIFHTY